MVDMLMTRGIRTTSADMLNAGSAITQEVLRTIAEVDFVAVVLGAEGHDNAMFELGVARGLAKPSFVVLMGGRLPFDFNGVYARAVDGPGRVKDAAEDLDRFLANAKTPPPIEMAAPAEPGVALDWALLELDRLRSGSVRHREAVFEDFVGRIFEAVGAQVLPNDAETRGIDFVVWLNEVSFDTGGPVLIECKVLRGGSGSVITNAKAYVKRLEKALSASNSNLALLVYDHDRPNTPPVLYETPQVLSFAIDDVIAGLQRGTFSREVLKRRQRATTAQAAD